MAKTENVQGQGAAPVQGADKGEGRPPLPAKLVAALAEMGIYLDKDSARAGAKAKGNKLPEGVPELTFAPAPELVAALSGRTYWSDNNSWSRGLATTFTIALGGVRKYADPPAKDGKRAKKNPLSL